MQWKIANWLAIATSLTLLIVAYISFVIRPEDAVTLHPLIGIPLGIAFLGLWFWMIFDVLSGGAPANPVFWFIVTFMFPAIGTLYYFFYIWRPKHRPRSIR